MPQAISSEELDELLGLLHLDGVGTGTLLNLRKKVLANDKTGLDELAVLAARFGHRVRGS